MKYLVTGGLGFIGSNLVDYLLEKGHEIVVVDDLSTGKESYKNPKATYYNYSIADLNLMTELTKGMDGIFHLAAWARLQRSINDPLGTNHANVTGTLTLLQAARVNKVEKFIFSSSSSVYGMQENPIMEETMSTNPLHPYALQKLVGEMYCRLYSKLFGIKTVALRYFNVYGPRQIIDGDYALVIGTFLKQKRENKKMTIYGDGRQTRAYTHVGDVVRANLLAMELSMEKGESEIFNIGTDRETSINEIAKMLGGEVEHIIPNPRGEFEERRKAANYSKALKILGWKPTVTIEEGIKRLLGQKS
ncbi:MAG: NAD-dependent epimerase/dehydratase family protein [Candidatus Levybacteria bacterium]|nr:NAD-dependent epimerase/dehydratase family protein [Candidatus Levybacteria bacterium]